MQDFLSKLFWPLVKNHTKLSQYRWHRFAVVMYRWLLIRVFLGGVIGGHVRRSKDRRDCAINEYQYRPMEMMRYHNVQEYFEWDEYTQTCARIYPTPTTIFFALGRSLLAVLFLNYLLQLFYFKVVLYIVYGNSQPKG